MNFGKNLILNNTQMYASLYVNVHHFKTRVSRGSCKGWRKGSKATGYVNIFIINRNYFLIKIYFYTDSYY